MSILDFIIKQESISAKLQDSLHYIDEYIDLMREYDEQATLELSLRIYKTYKGEHFNEELIKTFIARIPEAVRIERPNPLFVQTYHEKLDELPDGCTLYDFIAAVQYMHYLYSPVIETWFKDEDRLAKTMDMAVVFLQSDKAMSTLFFKLL